MQDTTLGWRFVNPRLAALHYPYSMGETAENVAERWGVEPRAPGRVRAARASSGRWRRSRRVGSTTQIVPVEVAGRKGETTVVARDEHPRADTSLEALGALRPAFKRDGGSVTAGNSSGINDGASAVLLVEASRARGARAAAAGAGRGDGGGGRRSGGHGRRAGAGDAQGAGACRARRRGPRPDRAERGLRVAVARVHRRAGPGPGEGQRERRERSRWATRWA